MFSNFSIFFLTFFGGFFSVVLLGWIIETNIKAWHSGNRLLTYFWVATPLIVGAFLWYWL